VPPISTHPNSDRIQIPTRDTLGCQDIKLVTP